MYVLPEDHSANPNEQMFSFTVLGFDGRGSMLATPGVPFDADSLGYTDEEFVQVIEDNNLPFVAIEGAEDMKKREIREAVAEAEEKAEAEEAEEARK